MNDLEPDLQSYTVSSLMLGLGSLHLWARTCTCISVYWEDMLPIPF